MLTTYSAILKVVCHEILHLHFFHDSNPSTPLINRLKYFQILFRFHRDIQIFKKLRCVHPTAESDSVVCIIPRSQTPRFASLRGVKLRSVHPSAESSSAVCIALLSRALQCASHCGFKIEIFESLWFLLKGQSGEIF